MPTAPPSLHNAPVKGRIPMSRLIGFVYGLVAYLVFFGT
jgi:hypothetical protein